ncbi:hypothetical protein [Quadrisphaera sp. DSM 44207]|uniref:hypothetical protein n=1 Tax=Quadrisphaera sp. DSM 44207 TaxID=1881057 RepID=UPI000891E7AC|nr:hypothetical protein [Quadrisphaera sp. DSM 44207]SDQ70368.1 hypothetical protein SAMN05428996_2467 [Quadrisphaera sp. DSM 44207]
MTDQTTAPTRPTSPTRRARLLAACCAGGALALTASGCGVSELITEEKARHFDTVADAPTSGELAFVLPDVVPDDATDITVRVKTTAPDLKAYDWVSASGELPADCAPAEPPQEVDEFYASGDWPAAVTEQAGQRCGVLHITELDGRSYAWIVG